MKDRSSMNQDIPSDTLSFCLNEFWLHGSLHSDDLRDQFLVILCKVLDLRKDCKFSLSVC